MSALLLNTTPAVITAPRGEVARHAESLYWVRQFVCPNYEVFRAPERGVQNNVEIIVDYFGTGRVRAAGFFRDGVRVAYVGATKTAQATVTGWFDTLGV